MALVAALTAVGSVAVGVPAGAQSDDTPGVTKKEIQLGAVIGKTNPTGVDYDQVIKGAEAYLDQVNDDGGVFGRKLKVVKVLDDQTRASKSLLAARSLVEETKVFAVLHASQVFAGSDVFVEAGTPVFGYNIQSEWSAGPSLFGTYGSYLCFECPQLPPAIAAHEGGAKRPAIFAYGSSPSSTDCAESTRDAFERWGPDVAVYDTSLSFGFSANDISGAVQAIKDRQVDFVTTCMDLQGIINLKKALEASGVQGTQFYAPQGYDLENLEQLGDSLDGFTFLAQFTPFEAPQGNPGMKRFLKAMKARNYKPSENYLVGWVGAMLLVRGIEDAGEDFTQDSVVEAINEITDWTADGIVPPVNWQTAHGPAAPGERDCLAFVQIGDEEFTPVFGKPRQPFVCYPINPYPPDLDSPAYYGAGDSET